jgi:hypothetical protein
MEDFPIPEVVDPNLSVNTVVSGLELPTSIAFLADGSHMKKIFPICNIIDGVRY